MTTSLLSFGDTFTLPVTGEHPWEIRDLRPTFAHLESPGMWTASARNTESLENAFYSPETGWHVSPSENRHETIAEQLEQLKVHLPSKSVEDYTYDYRRLLRAEARQEIREIVSLATTWTKGTDVDPLDLRAHVAGAAACAAAGVSIDGALYKKVVAATMKTLKEQHA